MSTDRPDKASRLAPESLRGYRRSWLRADIVAGLTLAAVAIPETMGYTSIAQVPVITGLYTVLFPALVFALLGSSRLLVVGADSATAAILAGGLAALGIAGLTPNSPQWLALASLTALMCGVLLLLARLLRLGFLGDFLSASVLIGFLTGVGIQVFTGQLPDMLGIPKGKGNWFEQQWSMLTRLGDTSLPTLAFAVGTLAIIVGFKRFVPKVPGAIVAVVLSIILASTLQVSSHGVAIVGPMQGGFPPVGLPEGIGWSDVPQLLGVAFSCFVLIIAQSAATSRSFATRHGQRVDINRDIVGLSGANLAAGLSGTFVVNGSPTKTQILDEQKGKTQLANATMALVVLVIVLFFTSALTNLPKPVLGAIVFLIGVDLIDIAGLRRVWLARPSEFYIAVLTAVVVFAVGVEQGIVLAVVLSIVEMVRRQYRPHRFVMGIDAEGEPTYARAQQGMQSAPGLLVFRYDADLFYANANQFSDGVQQLITSTPDPVRWLVLDCSSIPDIDYSAGAALHQLVTFVDNRGATLALAALDPDLRATLEKLGVLQMLSADHIYPTVADAVVAFRSSSPKLGPGTRPAET
ncbi:SulP family inorganic anion transporter [Terrabacter sp. Ter38]|uniref:SulP family inorganic anion transporter n=1 Tax=Terrabacter sp. Ter38 TaxID=2926030 RepID=UPI00211985E1|nr:SulP family inorganic anion transporter [Terrabacter sp. Ter38]